MSLSSYFMTLGDASSQLVNALLFNSKNANESISGKSYANKDSSKAWNAAYLFINSIFSVFGQVDHCASAFYTDRERAKSLLKKYPDDHILVTSLTDRVKNE